MAAASPVKSAPIFIKVEDLRPDSSAINLLTKVIKSDLVVTQKGARLAEIQVGDETGVVILKAVGDQIEKAKPGTTIQIRNATVKMHNGFMRLNVDGWGLIKPVDADHNTNFDVNSENDVSKVEYELIKV